MFQPTTRIRAEDLQRAAERCQQPRWAACRDSIAQEAEAFYREGVQIPEFDASWYRPEQPYIETYTQFHRYIFGHRPLFTRISKQLHAGIILGNDDWRRQALEFALGIAEAIDFRVTHYDSGMEFGFMAQALADVYLGSRDLLNDDERTRILRELRNVADAVLRCNRFWLTTELNRMAFNNHRICHMNVLLALGYCLEDESLVEPAFDPLDERGFLNYLDGAFYDDGLCYESSLHYHYATTSFLFSTALTQRALFPERLDLFHARGANGRTLRDCFEAPLATAFSGLELPRVGDNYGVSTSMHGHALFFPAYSAYDDPFFGQMAFDSESKHPLSALLYGSEERPAATAPVVVSRTFPEHGYALLRDDEGIHKQAFLTGDRSGIHHQRDGLQLQIELGGEMALYCTDIKPTSHHGFSDNIHERYNRWAHAHSQLTVDELDQKTHASPIPLREWNAAGPIKRMAMVDEHGDLQDGVHQGRFVTMRGDWICDCVIAASTEERTWRLFYHLPQGLPEADANSAVQSECSAFQSKLAAKMPDAAPWREMFFDGGTPPAAQHAWPSGRTRFQLATACESTLQRFRVPAYEGGRVGLWAEQRGQHAVFVTMLSPRSNIRIHDLSLGVHGNELVARWFVDDGQEGVRLQARISLPAQS